MPESLLCSDGPLPLFPNFQVISESVGPFRLEDTFASTPSGLPVR